MKKVIHFLILFFLFCNQSFAAVPVTFTNGTTADATEVNQNFNYFENKFSTTSGHDHDGSDSKTLTALGTVTTGTWQGTVIDEVYGGTGLSSYASGDLVYATSDTGLARLAKPSALGRLLVFDQFTSEPRWLSDQGTSGQFLQSLGSGKNSTWATISDTTSFKIITFTRDVSTVSGNASYTGVGFQPTHIIFDCWIISEAWSVGFSDNTTEFAGAHSTDNANSTGTSTAAIQLQQTAGTTTAVVNSLDSDGFTLTWTKGNTETGTATCAAFCYK